MHIWLNDLRAAPHDDIVARTRLQFVTIAAHGLKICAEPARMINKYRFRDATRLDEMDEEDKPRACLRPTLDDARVKANTTAEMGQLAINSLLEKASAAFDDKSVHMQESTVDFLTKAFPVSSGHVSPLTNASTRQQCLDHVGAGTFQHEDVLRVHASIISKPPDQQPDEGKTVPEVSPSVRSRRKSKPDRRKQTTDPFDGIQWSDQQLRIIDNFEAYCKAVSAWRALPNPQPEDLPLPLTC